MKYELEKQKPIRVKGDILTQNPLYCSNCGSEIGSGISYCPYCGSEIVISKKEKKVQIQSQISPEIEEKTEEESSESEENISFCVLFMFFVALLCFILI